MAKEISRNTPKIYCVSADLIGTSTSLCTYSLCDENNSVHMNISILINFSLQCELGEGQFGKVKKGILLGPDHIEVAVKILKDESEKVKLLKEAAIMGQFAHPNIVQLYGLTTITEPVSVHGVMQGWFEIGLDVCCCSCWCSGTL